MKEVLWVAQVGQTRAVALRRPYPRGEELHRRWVEGATLETLGQEEGISRQRVRQVMSRALPELHLWRPGAPRGRYWRVPNPVPPEDWTKAMLDVAAQFEEGVKTDWFQPWRPTGLLRPWKTEVMS